MFIKKCVLKTVYLISSFYHFRISFSYGISLIYTPRQEHAHLGIRERERGEIIRLYEGAKENLSNYCSKRENL